MDMRTSSLSNAALAITLALAAACGRKSDPVPRPRTSPQVAEAHWLTLRRLEVALPSRDIAGSDLVGVEQVRVYYMPLGAARPSAQEVLARNEVVLEKRRPDLPAPGRRLILDLANLQRPAGWVVVVAVRVGNVVGQPGDVLPWLDPGL
jgi:hypothetical protein